ncbi:MAG: alanine--tRNA ligase [Sedimentisphaerales bacterium]|nr:alanine--tRNA ligase [Sedimentisphaerales bacterium]
MKSAAQIRSEFIEFFKEKNHTFVPSSPIVPKGDETLLFANAGMNQFKDIFLGLTPPSVPRAVNSQKCLRVSGKHNDLEEVGRDTYHHTFFEMLGNWSFGDYFKAEAIEWAWELFTQVWKIDPNRLWATVFAGDEHDGLPEDDEAKILWTSVTSIPAERVLSFGKKDNFWEMGETGPCGPCSEIHIDLGPDRCDMKNVPGHECKVNAGCARYVELWNLVFIQYNRQPGGKLTPLSSKYVDTGAGLERVVAVMQDKKSNYDTDLFMPIINFTSELSGCEYSGKLGNKVDNALRVIADHIRSLVFSITDGATPSNDGRGYVIRRILRRASRFGRELEMKEPFLYKLVPVVVECLGEAFGEIKERADYVSTVIKSEEESFGRTIDRGLEIFNTAAEKALQTEDKIISGKNAFQLYDTFGFPLDLTQLMAQERNLKVDKEKFDVLMEEQRQRARQAQKSDSFLASLTDTELPVTEDMHKYHLDSCESKIVGWIDKEGVKDSGQIDTGEEVGLILDKTCFYAEMGGQVGDCGMIESHDSHFFVENTIKIANCIIHKGKVTQGTFSGGQHVMAIVGKDRDAIKKNHTATHLLQWALQEVLGNSVAQQGSYVGPEYLRFDFTYPKALTREEIEKVEELIGEKIVEDLPVTTAVLPREEAQELGAMALFGEKYGDEVRVVAVGAESKSKLSEAFSKEFCGGTHVDRIGAIGGVKIIKEESISAGVRRITAIAGSELNSYLRKASDIVDQLSLILKVPSNELVDRVEKLIANNKELAKKLKSASRASGSDGLSQARELLDNCQKIGESSVIVGKLSGVTIDQAREAIDMLKKKAQSAAIVLGFDEEGKVTLISGITNDLVEKGLSAGNLIKEIAPIVGGGGGGRPQMAQAGGKDPEKIEEALKRASEIIVEKLQA